MQINPFPRVRCWETFFSGIVHDPLNHLKPKKTFVGDLDRLYIGNRFSVTLRWGEVSSSHSGNEETHSRWVSNAFGKSDDSGEECEGFRRDWVTDP